MASGKGTPDSRALRARLTELLAHLRQIQSATVVAIAALRQQSCERDEDVARVLEHSVVDPLEQQIEQLRELARHPARAVRTPR